MLGPFNLGWEIYIWQRPNFAKWLLIMSNDGITCCFVNCFKILNGFLHTLVWDFMSWKSDLIEGNGTRPMLGGQVI